MPRRPLSAYNIFFKEERPALIAKYEKGESQPDFDANLAKAVEAGKDKDKGAVFQAASRTLAERWKVMAPQEREPYERQADAALKNYRKQIAEYQQRKESEKQEEDYSSPSLDATVSLSIGAPPYPGRIEGPSSSISTVNAPQSVMPVSSFAAASPTAPSNPLAMFQQMIDTQQQTQCLGNVDAQNLATAALFMNNALGGQSSSTPANGLASFLVQVLGGQATTQPFQFNTGQSPGADLTATILQAVQSWQMMQQQQQQQSLNYGSLAAVLAYAQGQSIHQPPNAAAISGTHQQQQLQEQQPMILPTSSQAPTQTALNTLASASAATAQLGEQELDLLRQLIELENRRRSGGPPPS
eukprot:scaffold36285_cov221-Amphora_coffeaeformis.AAC.1